ncbi:hypothetical protein GY45DRAFT_1407802 [Cubamyces sp. BRFM 1775]|nr:hypothetical protein GY45DRAFT_1407802 [Cubamyces sp. BRFM 1775]
MPSTQDEIAALCHKAEEERERAEAAECVVAAAIAVDQARLAAVKVEAAKKAAEAEAAEKAASTRKAAGRKGKQPALEVEEIVVNSDKSDEEEEEEEEVGPRMSSCTVCQRAAKACVGASGLPAKLQRRIERKSDRSPQRKKVKSAPFIIPDSDDEDGEAEYVERSPSARTKGKGKAAEKGKGKAVEKGKGKAKAAEKAPAAEKPLAPGPTPAGRSTREQLTDRELLQHLLVEMQRNRQTSGRVADLLAGEEAHREELWQKEQKALQAAVAESVRTEMKIELGISVRQVVRDELREQLEEFLQEFQEVMMTGNWPPRDSEVESDEDEERGSGRVGSEDEGAGEEEERGRSGSRGRAE